MITLFINGAERQWLEPLTIRELLKELRLESPAVAVEVNQHIVPRSSYDSSCLQSGDRIEIVTFVGGG